MSKLTKTQLEDAVKEAVKKAYQATDINVEEIAFDMPEGTAMYASFKVPAGGGSTEEDYCYVLVQPDGTCRIFDDGEQLVCFFQSLLDRKRSLWQRFNEINFNDLIGAFIAFAIVLSFTVIVVWSFIRNDPSESGISKEFLAIVSMVLGFYFGRSPKQKD